MIETEMKTSKPKTFLFMLVLLLAALGVSGYQLLRLQMQPVNPADSSLVEVRLPENSTAGGVAVLLADNGLIRNEQVFLVYCRSQGLDKQLQAGLYEFNRSMSLPQLAALIAEGKVKSRSLTIPEGFTVEQVGELLCQAELCTPQQWQEALAQVGDYVFLPKAELSPERRLEGFLYPDTYRIDEVSTAGEVLAMMLNRFSTVWDQEFAAQAKGEDISIQEAVIVASLIEREARIPDERKRIAGVIYNRLQAGMPLQIDATVIYSLGEHREILTYKDLEVDSPYNTYKHRGLPAGPIASPGRESIAAALAPETNDYIYYVARGDGSHQFSVTYNEHLAAKARYGL